MSAHDGWLWVNDEWIEVTISIDDDRVTFDVQGTHLGSWIRSEVSFSDRGEGRFLVSVDGEDLPFTPHSPLPFAAALLVQSGSTAPQHARRAAPGEWARQSVKSKTAVAVGALVVIAGIAGAGEGDPRREQPVATTGAPVPVAAPVATFPSTTEAPTTTTNVPLPGLVTVVSVTDGDTIRVRLADGTVEPVRLIGIDAPEPGQRLSSAAAAYLENLVLGREVELVTDVSDRDIYDRLLRYVYIDGVNVNEAMVLAGFAIAKEHPPDTAMASVLAAAQQTAQAESLGGWATSTTTTTIQSLIGQPTGCHPSYEGVCIPADVSDADCAGGSGDGPYYVRGPVDVVGPDAFGLDRDGDGVGCDR
jgi:endonuclease YncB( thermonuclease family)